MKLSKNQLEEALNDFRRAVELEPSDADALGSLAMGYGQIGRTTEAVRAYQQAVAAQPDYYLPHHNLGVYFYSRGQYDEALAEFQSVTHLSPGIAQGHLNLGGTYGKLGQYPESETEIREALRLREDRDTWLALGAVLAYRIRFPESAEAYEHAVEKGPATDLAMSNLGDAYRRCGRPSAARKAYQKALQIIDQELHQSPGSGAGPIRAFAGYLSARLEDRHRAKRETEDAIALSPGNTEVLRRAVLTYEVLGERDETIQILKTASKLVLEDLDRQPDLADLRTDSRFRKLISRSR
jgi:tetratricopeptide (TPR) repeat protein